MRTLPEIWEAALKCAQINVESLRHVGSAAADELEWDRARGRGAGGGSRTGSGPSRARAGRAGQHTEFLWSSYEAEVPRSVHVVCCFAAGCARPGVVDAAGVGPQHS